MIKAEYKGKKVIIEDVRGVYEEDIEFSAYFEETGEEIDDYDILSILHNDYASDIWSEWYENKISEAEDLYVGER